MKLKIISDLHQEFGFNDLSFDNADIAILAGDIHVGIKGIEWIINKITDIPVIYVLGNHEYYKGAYPKTLNKIKALSEGTNVHVLENESVEIGNTTFHGATLWTDFSLYGNPRQYGIICQSKMNDYHKIRRDPSYSKLRTIDTFRIHNQSVLWLENSLSNTTTKSNIVVTHHAPSIKSLPDIFKDNPLSAAYASNLEGLINTYQPDYWIHGHIHTPTRYHIGHTEVICNPHGYIDEKYNGYDSNLILEID
ncbi:metallophosphoesterase [Limibacter armeniacum]|uniref:metallophosphoesterase n=1 Tax=Limibacter armeniacum TaxID=466084 RepID=UPI002FE61E97